MIEQAKFSYSILVKAYGKQIKSTEDQGEKQLKALEEQGKQLIKFSGGKEYLSLLKQKEIFEELAKERMGEIQNLSKQINFDKLIYYFKRETDPKKIISFEGRLAFFKNIKDRYTTLNKAEEKKIDINEILKGRYKSESHKSAIKNIKKLYGSREKVIKLLNDYSKIPSMARYEARHGKRLKILTPKQILQRLPIDLAQVKADSTSENLLNEIIQNIYYLHRAKEITKKVYNHIMNSIKL